MPPEVGQIWREVDPRMVRNIRILRVMSEDAEIETVINVEGWKRKSKTGPRLCRLDRFTGRRGGYKYVEG